MESIYIPNLVSAPEHTEILDINEHLPDLETLTPVQGQLKVSHRGNYLEVTAQAEAIMTLMCDRCLQQYNCRISVNTTELIWLQERSDIEADSPDQEVALDDLVESLEPQGLFEPDVWLYEQFCLAIPQRKLCDGQCRGIEVEGNSSGGMVDRRWASLESLKGHLWN